MNDPTRRALRGFLQISVVQGAIQLWNAFAPNPMTADQVQAVTLFFTPLVSFAQNMLEDHSGLPAILKAPASEGQNPAPSDGGTL